MPYSLASSPSLKGGASARQGLVNGKVYHSGLKKPLRIKKDKDGIHIGCTYVSNDALIIFDKILKGEIS